MPDADRGQKSILVVDDDRGMADTLSDILEANHYRVATASSGDVAVAMTAGGAYDLILMDIQMPGLNGVQALTAMKARGLSSRVIMMTAYTRDELVTEAERTSGFPVLPKPLDLEHLLALASRATGRPRTPDETR